MEHIQIDAAAELRDVNDLSRVLRNMLDDMRDGVETSGIEPLEVPHFEELAGIEAFESAVRFGERIFEFLEQDALWDVVAFRKLFRAIAHIGCATDAGDDPLADISREVEDKIADAIIGLVRPPPDVFVG